MLCISALRRLEAKTNGIVDFDDLIYMPLLIKDSQNTMQMPLYDVVLVDEAQDSNPGKQSNKCHVYRKLNYMNHLTLTFAVATFFTSCGCHILWVSVSFTDGASSPGKRVSLGGNSSCDR